MSTLTSILLLATLGGYGDVDTAGHPSWAEREAFVYVNMPRVSPHSFEPTLSEYGCSSYADFEDAEEVGQVPLYYNVDLNRAARVHSADMAAMETVQAESSDGTSMEERLAAYYAGAVLENVGGGYADAWDSIIGVWMCDDDARANMMNPEVHELGTGSEGGYFTADFGVNIPTLDQPLRMGVHTPQVPTTDVTYSVVWGDSERPASILVVVDGEQYNLSLKYGTAEQGVYSVKLDKPRGTCSEYYFRWSRGSGQSGYLPEVGAYLLGEGCTQAFDWKDSRLAGGPPRTEEQLLADIRLVGCSNLPARGVPGLALLALLGALLGRRRASHATT
jgi:hypothetical protein